MNIKNKCLILFFLSLLNIYSLQLASAAEEGTTLEDNQQAIVVWGEQKESEQAGYTSPTSTLKPKDLQSINLATTEDSVKYEPSLVIRRRFIGDSNGTMGMRGSNMFQTSRSMVFADGVPLHYFLQSRWNGSPRWTMVSASEIAQVDVIYGPFSAEYGGNAMGGVVLIETKIPQKREVHLDGMYFSQAFDAYGFDDHVNGYKGFASYGDKLGKLSVYASYNHLRNQAQPQTYRYNSITTAGSGIAASGGIVGNDAQSNQKMYYGDTGAVDTNTDNVKLKLGYDLGNWFALLNIAYEDRNSSNTGNSYVTDSAGNRIWSGTVTQDGQSYSISASSLSANELNRLSLNTGLRLKGDVGDASHIEINLSQFTVLKDESSTSAVNPADPSYNGQGLVTDYDNTGWKTAETKWRVDELGVDGLEVVSGIRHEDYRLNINVFDSNNYTTASKDSLQDSSGGKTSLDALFSQLNWAIDERWDSSLGLRYESWKSKDGYYAADNTATPQLELLHTPSRAEKRLSPKFSIGVKPAQAWILRYSIAKAYRFPIVEELYSQYQAYSAKNLSNPELAPENGLHHNLMIERGVDKGYVRVNLFYESIKDVIEAQATILDGGGSLRTFIPIDKVNTGGIEFIANIDELLFPELDVRFNLTYTDSKIVENAADTTIEGNRFPRMPKWRGNLLATYNLSHDWDMGGNVQYASNSFGRLDNSDSEKQVYGAQDAYTFLGIKSSYRWNRHSSVSLGIDNLTNQRAYVAHPWPGRTYFINASYDL